MCIECERILQFCTATRYYTLYGRAVEVETGYTKWKHCKETPWKIAYLQCANCNGNALSLDFLLDIKLRGKREYFQQGMLQSVNCIITLPALFIIIIIFFSLLSYSTTTERTRICALTFLAKSRAFESAGRPRSRPRSNLVHRQRCRVAHCCRCGP